MTSTPDLIARSADAVARPRRLTVVGCGYLGSVHAAAMAVLGHDVVGFDVDADKVARLAKNDPPFFEPGLDLLLEAALATGRLRFTTSYAEAAEHGDIHFLCVGTPQRADSNAADTSYVESAVEGLGPLLSRPCLVVGKSTVPVGLAEQMRDRLVEIAPAGADVHLAWSPEFTREGFAVQDALEPDRVVVGVDRQSDADELQEALAPVLAHGAPYVVTDLATAQLVKNAANAFLATKISFINAMAELCEATGADVVALADALGHDARIGRKFLQAGLGFGGGCLPKDLRGFMARAEELGVDQALEFLREVDDINLRRRRRAVDVTTEMLGGEVAGDRRARRGVQARQRRHTRLPRARRRSDAARARCARDRHGPEGARQRAAQPPGSGVRRRRPRRRARRGRRPAPHGVEGVPRPRPRRARRARGAQADPRRPQRPRRPGVRRRRLGPARPRPPERRPLTSP
ncbi:MAG: nucleotide sugar dehydrogenase [Candidatus Nanopelagicales bacterium]